jgi:hypothetical protein
VWFAVYCWLINWQIFVLLLISSSSSKQLSIFMWHECSSYIWGRRRTYQWGRLRPTKGHSGRLGLFQWLDGLRIGPGDIPIFWSLLLNSDSREMWTECQFIGKWTEPFQPNHSILSYLLWAMSMVLWAQSQVLIAYILWLFLVNSFMYSYVQHRGL